MEIDFDKKIQIPLADSKRVMTIGVVTIPVAASGIQFLLTGEINEIKAVGTADFNGEVTWVFGEPKEPYKGLIEAAVQPVLQIGEYFEG